MYLLHVCGIGVDNIGQAHCEGCKYDNLLQKIHSNVHEWTIPTQCVSPKTMFFRSYMPEISSFRVLLS